MSQPKRCPENITKERLHPPPLTQQTSSHPPPLKQQPSSQLHLARDEELALVPHAVQGGQQIPLVAHVVEEDDLQGCVVWGVRCEV